MHIIQTQDLTRHFGDTVAVDHLELSIQRGEIFGLLGHNGAGKTTTVRLLNGVLTPTRGTAKVLGLDPMREGAALRRRTGVLTETPALYEQLNAYDNLRLFAELYDIPREEVRGRILAMLNAFDLADRAEEKVGGFSKGMKQRLALSRAFLHQPELLFLDEPTAGLDPIAAKQVNDQIRQLSHEQGRTVLLATHNLHDAQQLCERVAVLEKGRIIASGSTRDLIRQGSQRLQVTFEIGGDMRVAASTITALTQLADITIDGDRLTVDGMGRDHIPQVVEGLVANHIAVYRVAPHEPTLEDVYFALHQR